jgi:hypothetical protein
MSGKALADTILQNLQSLGVETKHIVGQGYDGAATMSGMFNDTQSHMRKKYPMALFIHRSSHYLNLAVSFICQISEIRNCMDTRQTICKFFGYPKRLNILQSTITKIFPGEKSQKLKSFCPIR